MLRPSAHQTGPYLEAWARLGTARQPSHDVASSLIPRQPLSSRLVGGPLQKLPVRRARIVRLPETPVLGLHSLSTGAGAGNRDGMCRSLYSRVPHLNLLHFHASPLYSTSPACRALRPHQPAPRSRALSTSRDPLAHDWQESSWGRRTSPLYQTVYTLSNTSLRKGSPRPGTRALTRSVLTNHWAPHFTVAALSSLAPLSRNLMGCETTRRRSDVAEHR